ncbi:DUF4097 domain-containing protein [Horticoccus luteus]|uniref:DUF4097 domain-containing protein n=1 Tax=Horticoccus luteus TaxID=2862869 RepID=A0A8F9TUI1_9BACT|nr:DUF4097 family beta strand repeat-containing protein [Horticoccus luteus]QYM79514.1 DUF4097 domain-containing protein [Horticoccus luteus]
MKTHSLYSSFLIAAAAAVILLAAAFAVPAAHAADDIATLKFSDPAQPGTLKIRANMGDFRIHGADVAEITVKSSITSERPAPRADGLRVLSSSASYSLNEKSNVATLEFGYTSWPSQPGEFDITVPRHTAIAIASTYGGDVKIADVTGDIEAKSVNGEIHLDRVSGSVLIETMNGEIFANFPTLTAGKPLSFSTMNGEVHLRVPADAKANLKLRTQNGAVLTDFDEKALVTKTQSLGSPNRAHGVSTAEIQSAVREGVRVAREVARDAARAAREAARAARDGAVADHDAPAADDSSDENSPPDAVAPMPPIPPLPPMTGGKLVSGTLNGGGVDVSVTTMNGDITFRKYDGKTADK